MLEFLIYLANLADNIYMAAISILIISTILVILFTIIIFESCEDVEIKKATEEEETNIGYKIIKIAGITWIIVALVCIFIPSSTTIYAMIEVNLSQKMYNNVVGSDLGKKVYKLIDQKLDEELKGNK